jgi:hypothetical protein
MGTRKRPKFGDVIEIPTPAGLGYFQYVNRHAAWGGLIRVFGGTYSARPMSLEQFACAQERFLTFVPLGAMIHRGIVEIVANVAVPEHLRAFPLFRVPGSAIDPETGKVRDWWLWDGNQNRFVGKLTPEQEQLPIKEVVNDTMLIHWIATGTGPSE